jgi:predicted DNA-binding transcriptional regulator AlpA
MDTSYSFFLLPEAALASCRVRELEPLAGLAEVAKICGVAKGTALRYTKRPDFPTPIDHIAAGPIWKRADVEDWASRVLPLKTGRPSSSTE